MKIQKCPLRLVLIFFFCFEVYFHCAIETKKTYLSSTNLVMPNKSCGKTLMSLEISVKYFKGRVVSSILVWNYRGFSRPIRFFFFLI
jgi:hypothetical protein